MPMVRAHLEILGRVQGVYYRWAAREEAERLGLTGWIRNLRNGNVEAMIEGDEKDVEAMIDWCYTGPPGAYVTKVQVQRGIVRGEFTGFDITY